MKRAIRNHLRDFVAILFLFVVALGVGSYILSQQRFNLPAWVPGIGKDFYVLNAEFRTAKSVTPGQGQTVTIAGVNVGEISKVELVEGRAVVEMKLEPKYGERVRKDATLLLRPKTGLEDMVIEMTPGSRAAAKAPEGWTIPVKNTLPNVQLDEILASLDRDTRDYLRLLVAGAGQGLKGAGDDLAATFKRFEPGAEYARRMTEKLIERRGNIRRSIHNLRLLVEAVGEKDDQLAQLIDSSNTVFRSFVAQDANIRDALQQLPPTLRVTNRGLAKTERLANVLGPALEDLRPTARALGPTLRRIRPFLLTSTPIIRDQLRPFARDVLPTVRSLRVAARGLAEVTPDLRDTLRVLNYLFNELAYNPPGDEDEGYLFWASWANHLGNLIFTTADAHGPIRRGTILISCTTAQVLNTIIASDPRLGEIAQLSGLPQSSQICPASSQAGGTNPQPVSGNPGGGR
ncbi:MAG TPA: MlaD family protein [Solirubrobacteraceae bacterium]|nr:MlaD family protein [Solirubrobacteraceae bacterium]